MWAATRIEPARIGILLMSEVIVGAISAALFAGEPFSRLMALGGALVVAAAMIETLSKPYHPRLGVKAITSGHISWSESMHQQQL
jgi:drug/metabolite transporter (DMT)-like permease